MTEYLIGILLLFCAGGTGDRGQATFHVQQQVGDEVKVFDGTIVFATCDGGISYYLQINEHIRAEDGTVKATPAAELIVRTGNPDEPMILVDRVTKTYRTTATEQWAYKDFPAGIVGAIGLDKGDESPFLEQEVAQQRVGSFNRLENGGFLLRVRDTSRGDLLRSITVQADTPGEREWFKKPYVVNVVFDISAEGPDESLFAVPDGFAKAR
jgi:hypothetical protein